MTKIFFKLIKKANGGGNLSLLKHENEQLMVKRVRPAIFGSLHNLLWRLGSINGCYWEYQLLREGKVVSRAEVISWFPKFSFMPRQGIHIGPCRTETEERGRGYYPYLLSCIVGEQPESEYYMIVNDTNLPSIRGVEKAGFRRFAEGRKTRLGRYIITKELNNEENE